MARRRTLRVEQTQPVREPTASQFPIISVEIRVAFPNAAKDWEVSQALYKAHVLAQAEARDMIEKASGVKSPDGKEG